MVKKALAASKEALYEVDKVLERKEVNGALLYKIKWKGYPLSACSWEPLDNLDNVMDLVEECDQQYQVKAKPSHSSVSKVVEIQAVYENQAQVLWRVKLADGTTEERQLHQLRTEVPDLVIDYLFERLKFVEAQ
jgi:hypothetical protein